MASAPGPAAATPTPPALLKTENGTSQLPSRGPHLVVVAGTPQQHLQRWLDGLRLQTDVTTVGVDEPWPAGPFQQVHFCIEQNLEQNLRKTLALIASSAEVLAKTPEIAYHLVFDGTSDDVSAAYHALLDSLAPHASKVTHCSVVGKYNADTVYVTEKDALVKLGQEIQGDVARWSSLKVLDYSHNSIRFVPGVAFPDTLQVLNIGGGRSLETLAGFKMPPQLRVLNAAHGMLTSIDYVYLPAGLRQLDLRDNRLFYLNYVEFPHLLHHLDLSQNNIELLKNIGFPRSLRFLSVANNPIECIKGTRFPDSIEYLDVLCIPNESMAGIKFPDNTVALNLQLLMTNIRGLKLPPYVRELNLACNGVNSINPLKLPNLIEKLYLACNNIKTLNKVAFPTHLRELYLGNNLVTTLKNVQFPPTLEVLDMEMNPHLEDGEKYITTLKDVVLPLNLRVLRLGYHAIKAVESLDFPHSLEELSLAYNDLRVFRNVRFGPKLKRLDLSGNQELMSMDNVFTPDTLAQLMVPLLLLNNLPAHIVERANRHELVLMKSLPYT